jgi:hypothetical protein
MGNSVLLQGSCAQSKMMAFLRKEGRMENGLQLVLCHGVEDGSKLMSRAEPLRVPEVGQAGVGGGSERCSVTCWLLTPVILATLETESGRITGD